MTQDETRANEAGAGRDGKADAAESGVEQAPGTESRAEDGQQAAQGARDSEAQQVNQKKQDQEKQGQDDQGKQAQDKEKQDLARELEELKAKVETLQEQLLRQRAEMDNMRKRARRDVEEAHKYALEKFGNELLPVIDSMEMGLAASQNAQADLDKLKEGADLTLKMFVSVLEKSGIESVSPQVGDKPDPAFHQVMSVQEDPQAEPDTILTVVQKGYTLNGRLMRPAMVIVAKAPQKQPDAEKDSAQGGSKTEAQVDEKA